MKRRWGLLLSSASGVIAVFWLAAQPRASGARLACKMLAILAASVSLGVDVLKLGGDWGATFPCSPA